MQTSQKHPDQPGFHMLCHQPLQEIQPYYPPQFQILDNHACYNTSSQGTTVSFQTFKDQIFTLESSTASGGFIANDSPSVSISSNRSPFSPQGSQSGLSDPRRSPENNINGSPRSGSSSAANDDADFRSKLRELEISLLGAESGIVDSSSFNYNGTMDRGATPTTWNWEELMRMTPKMDLKDVLLECARAVSDGDIPTASGFMNLLERMVSVSGDPVQRLGAYMLEGLRARLESSGSNIYRALKCEEPTSSELLSYMGILYNICPYWKFAYMSANAVLKEALWTEPRIHIIDFQIAQGTQYIFLIQDLAKRPGGPPALRITAVDDSQSTYARGGGLGIVGEKLSNFAKSCNVAFEFHDAGVAAGEVEYEHLMVQPGYAIAVNFPFVLHHLPDESVSTRNQRDTLLRLVKSLSPKVVTLTEQESNTNTSAFFARFRETMDYYTAMFESIDVARPRDDKQRIRAEQHCVARDIVNMVACEGAERVERHELYGKWRSRFMMAGFTPCHLSSSVAFAAATVLNGYDKNYRLEEKQGALFLGWKRRDMATCSAWR